MLIVCLAEAQPPIAFIVASVLIDKLSLKSWTVYAGILNHSSGTEGDRRGENRLHSFTHSDFVMV